RDLRLEAGLRDSRVVPARAAAELGSSPLGVEPRDQLDRGELGEAGLCETVDDRLAARLLVVPGERHLPHQVRVRALEALMTPERLREPHHALLATDASDLNRLGDRRHRFTLTFWRRSPGRHPQGRARAVARPR